MTRTIIMKFPVPQEGEQLENINHVIRVLLEPVIIDWRDPITIELMKKPENFTPILNETLGPVNVQGFPNGEAIIYLTSSERMMLAEALEQWHEIDTITKVQISDDDERHYFIEDLSRQLRRTDPDYSLLYNTKE